MATIVERKNSKGVISFQVKIRIKGRPAITKTFSRLTDAKNWARDTESDIKRGINFGHIYMQKYTLGQLIDRYLKDELPKRNSGKKTYESMLKWWKDKLGDYYASDITPQMISKYRDELQKHPIEINLKCKNGNRLGRPKIEKYRTNSTVNHYLSAISIVYSFGIEWGWVYENVVHKVTTKKIKRDNKQPLQENELEKLILACKNSYNRNLFPAVIIALTTSARYSEILNLKWKNIDFKNRKIYYLNTKNGDSRGSYMPDILYRVLMEHSKIRKIDNEYLFPSEKCENAPISLRKSWAKAKEASGIDIRFHDLRHLAASFLAMTGGTLLEIAQVLGHKTLEMVRHYSHLTENHTNKLVDKMIDNKLSFLDKII